MHPIIVEGGGIVIVRVRAPRGRLGMFSGRDDQGETVEDQEATAINDS
jgi:hypothetical protein